MTPLERVQRAERGLGLARFALTALSVLLYLADRRLTTAITELEEQDDDRESLRRETQRLRDRLDGALEEIHRLSPDQAKDQALDTQGSPAGEALDTQGSE